MFNGIELGMTWSKTELITMSKTLSSHKRPKMNSTCVSSQDTINTGVCMSVSLAKFTQYYGCSLQLKEVCFMVELP